MLQHVENSIRSRRLISRGEKILVAVSGGMDSMILLFAFQKLSEKFQLKMAVAHFNHQLRGRASDADENLVRKTATKLKLPVAIETADVKLFAKKSKLSVEMAARKLRHEFLARTAREQKIKTIVLAHHADDQVELFFLRLLRGAGGAGLAGMKWRSPSPANPKIQIVRPLLDLEKSELREFARENKIIFRDDATNFSNDFLRNRVRNELIPLLRRNYQAALTKTVLRLMEIVGAESDFVGEVANKFRRRRADESQIKIEKKSKTCHLVSSDFENLPSAIQRRILQMRLTEAGITADFDLIESLRRSPDRFVSVGPKISVARTESGNINLRTELNPEFNADEIVVRLSGQSGKISFAGRKIGWCFGAMKIPAPFKKNSFRPTPSREFFDADKIGNKIILRHWRAGDRFQPIGLKSSVKLQDLFTNRKISRARRRDLILATTAAGEIFWVEGLRISEPFKLSSRTKRSVMFF